jgi:membrane-associated protease RseP (regulator of RpoE activity)
MGVAVCCALIGRASADEEKADDEGKGKKRVVVIEEEDGDEDVTIEKGPGREDVIIRRRLQGTPANRWFLGIQAERDDDGVVIVDVLDGTPAAKAGLKADDRILMIGETEIKDVKTLIDTVQKSEGRSLDLKIKRGDEELTISVAPEKQEVADVDDVIRHWADRHELFARFAPLMDGDRLFRFHPGFVFGEHPGEFPKNARITIKRENEEPAQITIEREGKSWTVDEKSIDQLPKDLRNWARHMLAAIDEQRPMPEIEPLPDRMPVPGPRTRRFFLNPRTEPRADRDKELEELKNDVKELREMIEKLSKDK